MPVPTVPQARCPTCGTENTGGKGFCSSCGEPLKPITSTLSNRTGVNEPSERRRPIWPTALAVLLFLTVAGAAGAYLAGAFKGGNGRVPPPDPASERSLPQVLCREGNFGDFRLVLKIKPRECEVIAKGAPIDVPTAGTAPLLDLTWIKWGPESAIADGEFFVSSFGPRPATVRFVRPRETCGSLVFTELSITPGEAQSPNGERLAIEGCPSRDGSADVNAHLPLPGGRKCGLVEQQPQTDSLASDIQAKGIDCEQVRLWLSPGNRIPDTWNCTVEKRFLGDEWEAMSHSDISCSSPDGGATIVFVAT